MEKQHISDNKLDDYFALARDMKPIAGIDELESQIQNAGVGAHKSLFHKLKFKIVMSTSIIVIGAFVVSLFYSGNKTTSYQSYKAENIEKPGRDYNKVNKQERNLTGNSETKPSFTKNINRPLASIDLFNSSNTRDFKNEKNSPYILTSSNQQPIKLNQSFSSHKPLMSDDSMRSRNIKPIQLNTDQLVKLGFHFSDGEVNYQTLVEGLGIISFRIFGNGTDEGINYSELHLNQKDYYPVFITDIDCNNLDNVDSVLHASKPFKSNEKRLEYTNYSKDFLLLPVLIKRPANVHNGIDKDLIFWFKVTPSMLTEINGGEFIQQSIVKENRAGMNEADWTNKQNDLHDEISTAINRFSPLVLSKTQMEKLGFVFGKDSIQFKCTITGHGTINYFATSGGGYGLNTTAPLFFFGKGPDIYPEFITETNGYQDLKYSMNGWDNKDKLTDKYFLSEIRVLVPVLLKHEDYGFPRNKDMIFWFRVTSDFLAALPDTISNEMGIEYNELVGKGAKSLKSNAITNCKYFDVCQVPLEQEYGVKIYPNPAKDKINMEFWPPKNDGTIYTTVELTDLNGRIIQKNESPWYGKTAEMQLDNVKPGIYLVVYKLNTGEVITNKVMITR